MKTQESTVVEALINLFRSFEVEESQQSQPGKRRQAISPAALRKALHACCEERFQLGAFLSSSKKLITDMQSEKRVLRSLPENSYTGKRAL